MAKGHFVTKPGYGIKNYKDGNSDETFYGVAATIFNHLTSNTIKSEAK